ncbi:E3 ubiquitin/ISG15 ligase TRIM25-like isoform X2 [Alosa sapidissima]|nr:E3 ubiquitin/ISG15 ligase TRIM25-like isoform X2 [Alosa sapidissima]XP_041957727.1 E3 ubiquitin/ISG15 ligase TRIM25-like isoform X2 [Alosa sapidissima]
MLKRATSPEPFRSEKRLKQERPDSPAPSCLNFLKQERSDSSAPSCTSKDLPDQFKLALRLLDSSELTTSLLTKDHFTCSMCTEVLKDPVSIPCGHSYCRQCITLYWAQPNHAGHYACPRCSQTYSSCPALYTNSALAVVVQKLQHFSPVSPDHCYAGLGDVACDFCTGRKLRAVKSCLTCSASYCESHIRQHYTVAALQKHTLVEPQIQEQKLSQQHDIKIEDFKCIEGEDLEWVRYVAVTELSLRL